MRDPSPPARESAAEVEEILDGLGRTLQRIESERASGAVRPEGINALFRGVHSLKGLSGMMGRTDLTALAHDLEDYLDRLRMGEAAMDAPGMDLLFDALERLERLALGGPADADQLQALRLRLTRAAAGRANPASGPEPDLDERLRASLTRYEEHRLRENVRQGRTLRLVSVTLPLATFDADLRDLIGRMGESGEVISTLPSYEADQPQDTIAFTLLVGSGADEAELTGRAPLPVRVRTVDMRTAAPPQPVGDGMDEESDGFAWGTGSGSTVRVDIERLDRVMASVGELFIARRGLGAVARQLLDGGLAPALGRDLARTAREFDVRLNDLQRAVVGARMVPVEQVVGRLGRLVRKLSRRSGKQVRFAAGGGRTELDKMLMDRVLSPLLHLVRNALDHGIESADERRAAGKPEQGEICLDATQRGNAVVLTLSDDGRGIDVDVVRDAAIRRGLLPAGAALDLDAACELIFRPGFSSAAAVDEVSGRGVGLDVVRREIASLNGTLRLRTTPGSGTRFEIELPITLAILESMLVRAGHGLYAIPVSAISETLRLTPERRARLGGRDVLRLRGETLPLLDLARAFAQDDGQPAGYAIVARAGDRRLALGVHALLGQQEVLLKPIGRRLERLPGLAGATELGENETALVLDIGSLPDPGATRAA